MFRIFRPGGLTSFLLGLPGIILAITFHEMAHGFAAESMGDTTAEENGRLSLNPLAHLDLVGFLSMALFGFGWAKPVPINPNRFRNRRKGIIIVSLAGCVANLVLGFIALVVVDVVFKFVPYNQTLYTILYLIYLYNVMFGVFNLIPIPPLDGSHILEEFLPYNAARTYERYARYGFLILLLLLATGVVGMVINPIINFIGSVYQTVIGFFLGLF